MNIDYSDLKKGNYVVSVCKESKNVTYGNKYMVINYLDYSNLILIKNDLGEEDYYILYSVLNSKHSFYFEPLYINRSNKIKKIISNG